jgi:membrane protease subunit HflC
MKIKGIAIVGLIVLAVLVYNAAFTVDETEQAIVTQFGRIIGAPDTSPGLKFKIPFIQKANFFNKNILSWDGDPGQIPTLDKKTDLGGCLCALEDRRAGKIFPDRQQPL